MQLADFTKGQVVRHVVSGCAAKVIRPLKTRGLNQTHKGNNRDAFTRRNPQPHTAGTHATVR